MVLKTKRVLEMKYDVLVRELGDGYRNLRHFLTQGLEELEEIISEFQGEIPHGSDFYEMDMRFKDVLAFIRGQFPNFNVKPFEIRYEQIMQQVYEKIKSPVLNAPYLRMTEWEMTHDVERKS